MSYPVTRSTGLGQRPVARAVSSLGGTSSSVASSDPSTANIGQPLRNRSTVAQQQATPQAASMFANAMAQRPQPQSAFLGRSGVASQTATLSTASGSPVAKAPAPSAEAFKGRVSIFEMPKAIARLASSLSSRMSSGNLGFGSFAASLVTVLHAMPPTALSHSALQAPFSDKQVGSQIASSAAGQTQTTSSGTASSANLHNVHAFDENGELIPLFRRGVERETAVAQNLPKAAESQAPARNSAASGQASVSNSARAETAGATSNKVVSEVLAKAAGASAEAQAGRVLPPTVAMRFGAPLPSTNSLSLNPEAALVAGAMAASARKSKKKEEDDNLEAQLSREAEEQGTRAHRAAKSDADGAQRNGKATSGDFDEDDGEDDVE